MQVPKSNPIQNGEGVLQCIVSNNNNNGNSIYFLYLNTNNCKSHLEKVTYNWLLESCKLIIE